MTQVYKATISSIYMAQLTQNVMNFKSETGAGGTATGLSTHLRDNWVENIRFLQNQNLSYTVISVQEMLPTPLTPIVLDISAKVGTLAGTGYHPSIAGLFAFQTFDPSRRGRGRFYMGGVHAASVGTNGLVQSGALGSYVATALILKGFYSSGGSSIYKLCVGPRTYASDGDYQVTQTILARNYFGIQRKRNINVGS
jgi:hypothetical protein